MPALVLTLHVPAGILTYAAVDVLNLPAPIAVALGGAFGAAAHVLHLH